MKNAADLNRLPFELAYLALLTRYNLKPLSRWEATLEPREMGILGDLGLEIAHLNRRTLFGRKLPRIVFSTSTRYIDAYVKRFDGKRLTHSPGATRLEGFFFGYPSCCVEQFISAPYISNGLAAEDQRILFHWACPDCHSTRSLLRDYRSLYRDCADLFGGNVPENFLVRSPSGPGDGRTGAKHHRVYPWAASVAAAVLFPVIVGAFNPDPHILSTPDDTDGDGLSYVEEVILGHGPSLYDGNGNGILDGVDVSLSLSSIIAGLPRTPQVDVPYALDFGMDGVEQCAVCGEWIDMGFVQIVHPVRDLQVDVPYIGLHYLEHGSIGYDGSIHTGRVDVDLHKRILFPYDPPHILMWAAPDTDEDQLGDNEEPFLPTDPLDPDSDDDSVEDGAQLAETLAAQLGALPREVREDESYLIEHLTFGIETCSVCGETVNMGTVEIVNPLDGITLELPIIALHYLGHGSFGYDGDVHSGHTLPTVLDAILNGGGAAHWIAIENDTDEDGLTDDEELDLELNPYYHDSDHDGIPDGPDLAVFLHEQISMLPDYFVPFQPYIVHNEALGMYQCLICGEHVNMGFMEIIDPVGGTSATLSYYNDHFMAHGSFYTDQLGPDGRTDPRELVDILGVTIAGGGTVPSAAILENAPNPFNTATEISFNLPGEQQVSLAIFDPAGRKICEVYSGMAAGGRNTFTWNGTDASGRSLPAGVYFCKLELGSLTLARKILRVR